MIEFTNNGIVLVRRETSDGYWRTSINPGDMERATEYLDGDELAQVEKAWTPEVVEAWEAEVAANNERLEQLYNSQPQGVDEVAELRAMVVELKAEIEGMKGSKEK